MAKATARYYSSHPAAKKVKAKYQSTFNKKPDQVKKRVELTTYNRKQTKLGNNKIGDKSDASHHGKKIVGYSTQSRNRADRNNSKGDKAARGGGKRHK